MDKIFNPFFTTKPPGEGTDGRLTMDFARSADGALKLINNAAGASFLILSDINMPGMTGLELLPKAKAEALLTTPIDFVALRNPLTEGNKPGI